MSALDESVLNVHVGVVVAPTRRALIAPTRNLLSGRLPRDTLPPDEADKYEMACRGLVAEFAAVKLLPESVPASSPYTGNMYKGACTIKCPCAVVVPTVFAKYLSASISSSQLPDVSLHAETFEKPVNQSGDGAIIVSADNLGRVASTAICATWYPDDTRCGYALRVAATCVVAPCAEASDKI